MNDTGLFIDKSAFMKLPQKQQMALLYENQLKTIEAISSYKVYQKVTGAIGTILIGIIGWMGSRVVFN